MEPNRDRTAELLPVRRIAFTHAEAKGCTSNDVDVPRTISSSVLSNETTRYFKYDRWLH